jgi:hypothetical protein
VIWGILRTEEQINDDVNIGRDFLAQVFIFEENNIAILKLTLG